MVDSGVRIVLLAHVHRYKMGSTRTRPHYINILHTTKFALKKPKCESKIHNQQHFPPFPSTRTCCNGVAIRPRVVVCRVLCTHRRMSLPFVRATIRSPIHSRHYYVIENIGCFVFLFAVHTLCVVNLTVALPPKSL